MGGAVRRRRHRGDRRTRTASEHARDLAAHWEARLLARPQERGRVSPAIRRRAEGGTRATRVAPDARAVARAGAIVLSSGYREAPKAAALTRSRSARSNARLSSS